MAKYEIVGFCFEHGGEIVRDAKNKGDAELQFKQVKDCILNQLNVSRESSAIVTMYKGNEKVKRERVEHEY